MIHFLGSSSEEEEDEQGNAIIAVLSDDADPQQQTYLRKRSKSFMARRKRKMDIELTYEHCGHIHFIISIHEEEINNTLTNNTTMNNREEREDINSANSTNMNNREEREENNNNNANNTNMNNNISCMTTAISIQEIIQMCSSLIYHHKKNQTTTTNPNVTRALFNLMAISKEIITLKPKNVLQLYTKYKKLEKCFNRAVNTRDIFNTPSTGTFQILKKLKNGV